MSDLSNDNDILLTGIKPTGMPHIGNYLGAINPALALQTTAKRFFFIADYHALTSSTDASELQDNKIYGFIKKTYAMLMKLFDEKMLSFKIGAIKPELTIYQHGIKLAACLPSECFYIDDIQQNLIPAKKMGLHTHHFENVNLLSKSAVIFGETLVLTLPKLVRDSLCSMSSTLFLFFTMIFPEIIR